LRRARKARNWTLERLVEEIDLRTPGGHSGVTPSMVSGWELGRHMTSTGYRAMLCEIFGQPPGVPPHHQVLKDHLLALLRLRDPRDRSLGVKTLHGGMVEDTMAVPERFFCASEQLAVVPIPSLTSHEAFDCGVALGPVAAARLLDHGRQAYAAARRIETAAEVSALDVLRERSPRP
jgi:transcriptional regulator with XRE-family HTH domain